MIVDFIKFIAYLLFSDYRKISKQASLLKISEQMVNRIAAVNTLRVEKVSGLTIHASRTNYVLTKA
jgi:hypothetical protein